MAYTSGGPRNITHLGRRESNVNRPIYIKVFLLKYSVMIFSIFLGAFKYSSGFWPTVDSTAVPGGQATGSVTGEPGKKTPCFPVLE